VTGTALSMPSMIGLIMLMGIATKNSILLIDYVVLARRDHGLDRWSALLDACRKRARPIIMTTVAMGAGMLPIAIGLGTDPSFRAPMAIVVIGGLITSTFLSLLVIPVVFTYVDDGLPRQQPRPQRRRSSPPLRPHRPKRSRQTRHLRRPSQVPRNAIGWSSRRPISSPRGRVSRAVIRTTGRLPSRRLPLSSAKRQPSSVRSGWRIVCH
jgi:predicted RND superfamily exporter protein